MRSTAWHWAALLQLCAYAASPGICAARSAAESAALPGAAADAHFERLFGDDFLDDYWQHNTDQAIFVGYYRVADRLLIPDGGTRAEYLRFLDRSLVRLHRISPRILNPRNRTDWALLDNELRWERWSQLTLREWQWNPAQYNVAEPFALILNTQYAPLDQRLRSVLQRLAAVPDYYAAARASIHNPTHEHTTLAIEQNRGAAEVFGAALDRQLASSGLSAQERSLFVRRSAAARAAVEDYVRWLQALDRKLVRDGARSFRIGRSLYDQKFIYVHQSGDTAQGLYQRALQEKQQVLAHMEQLSDQLWSKYFNAEPAPEDRAQKIGKLIERLEQDHVSPQDYVATIRQLIPKLAQWVQRRDLIDLDPQQPLEVRETPVYERGVSIASVEAPGPYDPGARTYFNVDPLDQESAPQAESFLREYNNWMLPVFIIHEAIPGHYVQLMYANRSPSRIKSIFGNGAMIEGWAVYCERMMLESGYGDQAPELWLMYWKWYLRAVTNTILDYGVHVLGMTEADAKQMLTREAFQSENEAANKWQRVQRSSVQLTQYFSGFSAIYNLRAQRQRELGTGFDLKRFHEQFLSYGSAPVTIIEQMMRSQPAP